MMNSISPAQELRDRAMEYARRASLAQDFAVEHAYRRLARHCRMRAAELERGPAANQAAPSEEKPVAAPGGSTCVRMVHGTAMWTS